MHACRVPRGPRGRPCGRERKPATTCRCRSSPRDTAQEQPFDVLIHYRYHPRAGERVSVVRRLRHGGSTHFVVDQPDGTRGLLPAWMTEAWAAQLATMDLPRLTLPALRALRGVINSAPLSLSSSPTMREGCDDGPASQSPTVRSARARRQCPRTKPGSAEDSAGSDTSAETADGGVRSRRRGAIGRGH